MNTQLSKERLDEIEALGQALGMEVSEQRELVRGYRDNLTKTVLRAASVKAGVDIVRKALDDLREVTDRLETAALLSGAIVVGTKPNGYAYIYPTATGEVIRHNNGEEVNGVRPIRAIPYSYHSEAPTVDDETSAGMSELNDGLDFSEQANPAKHCVTIESGECVSTHPDCMHNKPAPADVYAKRAQDVEQHHAQGEALRPINERADVTAEVASIESQDRAVNDSLRLAAERAVTDDMIEACRDQFLNWDRYHISTERDVREVLTLAMMVHIKATSPPPKQWPSTALVMKLADSIVTDEVVAAGRERLGVMPWFASAFNPTLKGVLLDVVRSTITKTLGANND